jgi:hypothetical protein
MNATTCGLDIAKSVFQLYWVDGETGEVSNRRFSKEDLILFLAKRPTGQVDPGLRILDVHMITPPSARLVNSGPLSVRTAFG